MRTFSLVSVSAVAMLVLSGCGTQGRVAVIPAAIAPSIPSSSMPEVSTNLRTDLETIYNAARLAIDEATPTTYFTYVEEATKDPQKVAQFMELWPEAQTKSMMKNFLFRDLQKTEFIKTVQQGDWAGYYYLSDLEEADRLTINLFRFHKVNGKWMAYPRTSISSVPFEGKTPEERARAIDTEIQESDSLKTLEGSQKN